MHQLLVRVYYIYIFFIHFVEHYGLQISNRALFVELLNFERFSRQIEKNAF